MPTPRVAECHHKSANLVQRQEIVVVGGVKIATLFKLFEIVHAGDALGGHFGPRKNRQQQRRQNGDNRDDHQQLDEGERIGAIVEQPPRQAPFYADTHFVKLCYKLRQLFQITI